MRSTDVGTGKRRQLVVFFWSPRDKNKGLGLGNKFHLKILAIRFQNFCIIYVIIYFQIPLPYTSQPSQTVCFSVRRNVVFFQAHEAALLSLRAKQMTSLVQNQITQLLDA